MKKTKASVFILILAGLSLGVYLYQTDTLDPMPLEENQTEIYFEDHRFNVEIADTSEERVRGLMFREDLGENQGMLFVYEEEADRSFWMKNTVIPLDIIFLNSDFEVINIEQANPEPNTSDENLASYRSERPAQYVLEINQNISEKIGLKKGSEMSLGSGN